MGQTTGSVVVADYTPGGSVSGIVIGVGGPSGGCSSNPATGFSYQFRRMLRPIRVAPAIVLDGSGRHIATITVDPVTGDRRRVPVESESKP
jgi:hypothetical protein